MSHLFPSMTRWLLAFALAAAPPLAPSAAAPPRTEFFVAPRGNDTNPGTQAEPFASPEQALRAARATPGEDQISLLPGIYFLKEPLLLDARDSGLVLQGLGGGAILSGGQRVGGWKISAGQLWSAAVPEVQAGRWFFRQLFVDDRRATRARWPNADGQLRIAAVGDGVKSFTFQQPLPPKISIGQDAELVVFQNWSISRAQLASAAGTHATTRTPVGWIGHGDSTTASAGKPAYLEHARSFLDRAGEWFLDRATGTLFYQPLEGQHPAEMVAVAPRLEQLLLVRGTRERPVRDVHVTGLRFEHAEFPLPPFGYNEIQAGHYGTAVREATHVLPVALECQYAENCRFDRCRLAHVGAAGLGFGAGCQNNTVTRCVFEDIGGNGLMIGWRDPRLLTPSAEGTLDADWTNPADAPRGNAVSDCLVQRCGATSQGCVGIFVAFSADTRLTHNLLRELPYTGISLGYRWNSTPTSQQRNLVQHNHIHNVMQMLTDGGGIYTLGFQPGTVLLGNHIHHVQRNAQAYGDAPNNGLFIDEGSKGLHFEANVVYATSGGAVRFNGNQRDWHTWTANHFDDAEKNPAVIQAISSTSGPRFPFPVFSGTPAP